MNNQPGDDGYLVELVAKCRLVIQWVLNAVSHHTFYALQSRGDVGLCDL